MRFLFLILALVFGVCATSAWTTTVTATTRFVHGTSDWTPYIWADPDNPRNSLLIGSEIFEEGIYYDPSTANLLRLPIFDTGTQPFDWIHVSHNITMRVEGTGPAGSAGGFDIALGSGGTRIASARYDRSDGIWTSGSVRSVGTIALSSADFALFSKGGFSRLFWITGGAASYRSIGRSYSDIQQNYPDFNFLELSHLDASLRGSITVTAGYGGVPEPFATQSFVTISQVPLPASGLLLGAGLLTISTRRRRQRE